MGQFLGKEKLLEGSELKKEKVTFENGDFVYVREMTGHERDTWEHSMLKPLKGKDGKMDFTSDTKEYKAKLAVCTVCDEEGNLLFKFDEYPKLSKSISAATLEKIVNVAQKLNAITQEEQENLLSSSEENLQDNSTSDYVDN